MAVLGFENQAPETERDKDVYRIYSQMMTPPQTSHGPDTNPRYLISETTRWEFQSPCGKPPADREAEFNEVLDDFAIRKGTPRVLQRRLTVAKPYELLSSEQVRAFQARRLAFQRLGPMPSNPPAIFEGVIDLFTLSDVYFSKNGKLAMTGISTWCGPLCALSQVKVYEKLESGEWKERPWANCLSFASLPSVPPTMVLASGRLPAVHLESSRGRLIAGLNNPNSPTAFRCGPLSESRSSPCQAPASGQVGPELR
jgi:hypothetical protein